MLDANAKAPRQESPKTHGTYDGECWPGEGPRGRDAAVLCLHCTVLGTTCMEEYLEVLQKVFGWHVDQVLTYVST